MKKILLYVFLAALVAAPAAEPKKALVEIFTNAHCGPCGEMYAGIAEHLTGKAVENKITYIFYHVATYTDDILYQASREQSLPRAAYYGNVSYTPTAFFDGIKQSNNYAAWEKKIDSLSDRGSSFSIRLDGALSGNQLRADALILSETTIANPLKLHLVLVENVRYKGRNNVENHNNVMRTMMTGISGMDISLTADEEKQVSWPVPLSGEWDPDSMGIVCFIQDPATKEIYQSVYFSLRELMLSSVQEETGPDRVENFPNPFGSNTSISYSTATPGNAILEIFNASGRTLRRIAIAESEGRNSISWDGRDDSGSELESGIYYYTIRSGGTVRRAMMARIR